MKKTSISEAVIYCRVSSEKQVREGNGLASQENKCRAKAKELGLKVTKIFTDEGVSGKHDSRTGFDALLLHIANHSLPKPIVIAEGIDRIARNVAVYHALKQSVEARGTRLYLVNQDLNDTPEGKFIENLQAANAQYERDSNRRRVLDRMGARIKEGYWPFKVPVGYINAGKSAAVLNHDFAPLVKEVFIGFANGRFQTVTEVKNFLDTHEIIKSKYHGKGIGKNYPRTMLQNIFYTGVVEYPKWGIGQVQGRHEAIIDTATFYKVQERLNGKSKTISRKDINTEFPLRGYIKCSCCGTPLTASFSKGRKTIHPYYRCKSSPKVCRLGGKSVRREKIENELADLIKSLTPNVGVLKLAKVLLNETYQRRVKGFEADLKDCNAQVLSLKEQRKAAVKKMLETQSKQLAAILEQEVVEADDQIKVIEAKMKDSGSLGDKFGTALEMVTNFVENPYQLWQTGDFEKQRGVLKLIFADKLSYDRETGFGTVPKRLSFRLLESNDNQKDKMVLPRGLNSNRVEQLQVVIKDWVEIYKSPPQLDGKTFQWEPLSNAA